MKPIVIAVSAVIVGMTVLWALSTVPVIHAALNQ